MKLKIKPFNDSIKSLYINHGHFHDGDAGIDLFVIKDQTIESGETAVIHLGIACENVDLKPYLLMPRSSIAKTPLRLCNSVGLIDAGYRGSLVGAFRWLKPDNETTTQYIDNENTRLLQICHPSLCPIYVTLSEGDELSTSLRGTGGFGSTG